MTTLNELKALAEASIHLTSREVNEPEWYASDELWPNVGYIEDASFIVAANPQTILALIALIEQQHEALQDAKIRLLLGDDCFVGNQEEALAAYEKFGGE